MSEYQVTNVQKTLYFVIDSMFKGIYHGKQAHKGKSGPKNCLSVSLGSGI